MSLNRGHWIAPTAGNCLDKRAVIMDTLAITGGTGFLGRHLVKECLVQGKHQLKLLARCQSGLPFRQGRLISVTIGNLLQPDTLTAFCTPGCILIHLAFMKHDIRSNLMATRNLIAAANAAPVRRVIHCSTATVVGHPSTRTINEDTEPRPRGIYQTTKYRIEQMLVGELDPSIELAILRPTEIFGAGGSGLTSLIHRIEFDSGFKNWLFGFMLGRRRFNYIHVRNVVEAIILLATTPYLARGQVYIISDDDEPCNNYASTEAVIRECLGRRPRHFSRVALPPFMLKMLFKVLRKGSRPDLCYDHQKISELGYRRKVAIAQGIAEVIDLMRNPACG